MTKKLTTIEERVQPHLAWVSAQVGVPQEKLHPNWRLLYEMMEARPRNARVALRVANIAHGPPRGQGTFVVFEDDDQRTPIGIVSNSADGEIELGDAWKGIPEEAKKQGREIMARVLVDPEKHMTDRCALCGAPSEITGLALLSEQARRRIGEPRGKTRLVPYAANGPTSSTSSKIWLCRSQA